MLNRKQKIALAGMIGMLGMLLSTGAVAGAQTAGVIVARGGAGGFVSRDSLPIGDDVVRSLLSAHHPEALQGDSLNNGVVIVLDNAGQYQNSIVRHIETFEVRPTSSEPASAEPRPAGAVMLARSRTAPGAEGFLGTGYAITDIASTDTKHYQPGDMGAGALVVTVITLR